MAAALATLDSRDAAHAWLLLRQVRRLVNDSRKVAPGDAFVAWPGYASDGRRHVPDALRAGAVACLVEAEGAAGLGFEGEARVAALRGLKAAAGDIASRFLGAPSEKLDVIAVTGTNGKTSTAWWVAQAMSAVGRRSAVIGTLGIGEPPPAAAAGGAAPALASTGLTTPDPITLQAALADFASRGFSSCAIEASSIGIAEHRLAGTRVAVAVFTNFTQDHLDYHGDMMAYWQAKAQLFAWPGLRAAVVNLDDAQGIELAQSLQSTPIDTWTVSTRGGARLVAANIRYGRENASDEEIRHAATVAQAIEFVDAMPETFASPISQGGINLSGGQKQRLSIARAIVRKPDVYVFDDSFSALDFATDARLRAALREETGNATVFVVAQRISTVINADRIIVLDNGRVAGVGTHAELLENNEIYREIVASQVSLEEVA